MINCSVKTNELVDFMDTQEEANFIIEKYRNKEINIKNFV